MATARIPCYSLAHGIKGDAIKTKYAHLLQAPSNQDLRPRLPVLLCQFLEDWFLRPQTPDYGTIRFDHNAPFLAPLDDIVPLQPRMQLPLSNIQRAADFFHVGFEFIQMVHAVVADAKRANLTSFLRFDQSFPCAFPGFGAAIGRVDLVEINVGELGL